MLPVCAPGKSLVAIVAWTPQVHCSRPSNRSDRERFPGLLAHCVSCIVVPEHDTPIMFAWIMQHPVRLPIASPRNSGVVDHARRDRWQSRFGAGARAHSGRSCLRPEFPTGARFQQRHLRGWHQVPGHRPLTPVLGPRDRADRASHWSKASPSFSSRDSRSGRRSTDTTQRKSGKRMDVRRLYAVYA